VFPIGPDGHDQPGRPGGPVTTAGALRCSSVPGPLDGESGTQGLTVTEKSEQTYQTLGLVLTTRGLRPICNVCIGPQRVTRRRRQRFRTRSHFTQIPWEVRSLRLVVCQGPHAKLRIPVLPSLSSIEKARIRPPPRLLPNNRAKGIGLCGRTVANWNDLKRT
jgi:hypothetical protein